MKILAMLLCLSEMALTFSPTVSSVNTENAQLFQNVKAYEQYTISSGYDYCTYTKINATYRGKPIASYIMEAKPGDAFYFDIGYGQYTYGQKKVAKIVDFAKNSGKQVLCAINGNFFDFDTGLPLGILMRNGEIISDDDSHPAFYIAKDNSAGVCYPKIKCSFEAAGITYNIQYINKRPKSYSVCLTTDAYSTSTHSQESSLEIVFDASSRLYANQNIRAVITDIRQNAKNTPIGKNQFVVTVANNSTQYEAFSKLKIGDEAIFRADAPEMLTNAKCAIGGYHLLISDGKINEKIQEGNLNPRSAIGVKADGTVVLYSCDGRQPEYSAGLGLLSLATFFYEQGCVAAVNLDGGGSTTFYATTSVLSIGVRVNRPSYTSERSVSDALLLFSDQRIVVREKDDDTFAALERLNSRLKQKASSVSPYLSGNLPEDEITAKIAQDFFQ